jgi:hypothetical protein
MSDELDEHDDGFVQLSTGTEAGVAAFFLSAPFLGMASAMLGLGEAGIIGAAIGGGALGLLAKVAIDGNAGKQMPGTTLPGMARLRSANWRALFASPDIGEEVQAPSSHDADEQSYDESGEYMVLSPTLRPHADRIFSGRKVLIGESDAGKSNTVAVICEEIARFGAPLFLLDTEDEYRALCDKRYFPRPVWVDRERIPHTQAYDFAQWAMNKRVQVIINLQSYEDDEAAWLMIDLIKGIRAWEESHDRIPCEIILDEATVWLPQNVAESTLSRIMVNDPEAGEESKQVSLLALLQRAFFSVVVRRGRKRGMGFTFAAQRIAEIDKRALQASWLFLMRQVQNADLKAYREYGIGASQVVSLAQGEAFVLAQGKAMERHQFRLRKSPHGAHAPGLAELRKAVSAVSTGNGPGNNGNTGGNSVETRPVADATNIIRDVFPVSEDGNGDHVSTGDSLPVSVETRKRIQDMKEAGYPDREIAHLVGLSGRKYTLYRQVVATLGYTREA